MDVVTIGTKTSHVTISRTKKTTCYIFPIFLVYACKSQILLAVIKSNQFNSGNKIHISEYQKDGETNEQRKTTEVTMQTYI